MSMNVTFPVRGKERNGARIAQWQRQQSYNVQVAASDQRTPVATLGDIAMNGPGAAVAKVASNPATPPDLLRYIAQDHPTFEINKRLASNPNTPHDVLWDLANVSFGMGTLWERIAGNPSAPTALLACFLPYSTSLSGQGTLRRWSWKKGRPYTAVDKVMEHPNRPDITTLLPNALLLDPTLGFRFYRRNEDEILFHLNVIHHLDLRRGQYLAVLRVLKKHYQS